MGLGYAYSSLVAIVVLHGKDGLTMEEILQINEKTYNAKIEEYYFLISPDKLGVLSCGTFIEIKDGKYFLKPQSEINKSWLEDEIQRAEKYSILPLIRTEKTKTQKTAEQFPI